MRTATGAGAAVAAIDVGGTSIKGVLMRRDGRELARHVTPTPVGEGDEALVETVAAAVAALSEAASCPPQAIGLVLAGLIDTTTGTVRFSANIGLDETPIRSLLTARTGIPVAVDHDGRAAALAEATSGAASSVGEALVLTLGTGIAGAVITAGQIVIGSLGMAGEIGHMPVMPDGDRCACGQHGCAEAYASASSLTRRYAAQGGAAGTSATELFGLWQQGDALAGVVIQEAITALGRALVSYTVVMDPARIVIGGGMSAAGDVLLDPLRREVASGLAWRGAPDIVPAHFGPDAGCCGAALIAWGAIPASTRGGRDA